jgi:hypothetical protein
VNLYIQPHDPGPQSVYDNLPISNDDKGNEDKGTEDMNMGYESDSVSERNCFSDSTTDETSSVEPEAEHDICQTNYQSAFETYAVPDEERVNDAIPIINASKFRKPAYE